MLSNKTDNTIWPYHLSQSQINLQKNRGNKIMLNIEKRKNHVPFIVIQSYLIKKKKKYHLSLPRVSGKSYEIEAARDMCTHHLVLLIAAYATNRLAREDRCRVGSYSAIRLTARHSPLHYSIVDASQSRRSVK